MLILGRVHMAAHLVGRGPELFLKAKIRAVAGLVVLFLLRASHGLLIYS